MGAEAAHTSVKEALAASAGASALAPCGPKSFRLRSAEVREAMTGIDGDEMGRNSMCCAQTAAPEGKKAKGKYMQKRGYCIYKSIMLGSAKRSKSVSVLQKQRGKHRKNSQNASFVRVCLWSNRIRVYAPVSSYL